MNRRRWVLLALVFAGMVISYVDRGNLGIAAPSIMRDFGLSPASMGVLLSAFFWTYGLFQIPAGLVVDRFGIWRVYAAAFFIWSLASAGIALSRGFGDVLWLRLLLGLAETIGPVASLSFIRQNFPAHEHGVPVAIYIAGQNIGPATGTLVGAALLSTFGWRAMFAVTGLGALIWVPFWLFFAREDQLDRSPERSDGLAYPLSTFGATAWVWHLLSSPAFWAISVCVFFFSYYWYFLLTWMPAYLTMSRGFSTLGMGRNLSAPLFLMAATNVLAGWIADKLIENKRSAFQVRTLFAAAGFFCAGFILLLDVLPSHSAVLPILLISICSFGIGSSNFWAISQNIPPATMVGRAIGFLNTISQLGGVTAPVITGWSLGPEKRFGFAILLAGVSPIIASVLLLAAGPRGLEKLKLNLASRISRHG